MSIERVLYVSSKASDTSLFNIELRPSLDLDLYRQGVYLSCLHAEMTNSIHNISNDFLRYHDGTEWRNLVIPPGNYTVEQVNDIFAADNDLLGRISVSLNSATRRVQLRFIQPNYRIDFTDSRLADFLGFDRAEYGPSTPNQIITAADPPKLRPVKVAYIHCTLSNSTSTFNGKPSNIIDSMPLGNEDHIVLNPTIPLRVDCSSIIGSIVDNVSFWLADEDHNVISLNGESWSGKFLLEII